MQDRLHPVRYKETLYAANQRFQEIVMDSDRPERLVAEVVGIGQAEMLACRQRLNLLESSIATWAGDGKFALDASSLPSGLLSAEVAPFDIDEGLTDRSVYVYLGSQDDYRLERPSGEAVEGFYVTKSHEASAYEVIFVCGGPTWGGLKSAPYSQVLRCASRIAAVRLETGARFSPSFAADPSMCDPELLAEGALARSLSAAGVVLSILASKNRGILGNATLSIN